MNEILDQDDFDEESNNRTNIILRTLIYLFVMIGGGMLYMKHISGFQSSLYNMIYGSVVLLVTLLIINGFIALVKAYIRKIKKTNSGDSVNSDPIWFDVLENTFSWWAILMLVIVIGRYI